MSLKIKTPNKMVSKTGSSSGTKKQLSLMSFFKPATTKAQPASSSPLKNKVTPPMGSQSDKENDNVNNSSMLENTDTPLTSDTEASPLKDRKLQPNLPQSSPYAQEKKPLQVKTNLASSPITKRRSASRSVSYEESDDEDTVVTKKRRRIVESDDEEEEEDFKPEDHEEDGDDDMSDFVVDDNKSESEVEEDLEDLSENEKDVAKPKSKSPPKKSQTRPKKEPTGNALGSKFKAGSSYSAAPKSPVTKVVAATKGTPTKRNFSKENEERYHWLVDIKDGEKRTVDHPDYDARTLYVPQSAWSKFTAFEKQYWEIKSQMWNTVVFFKKGKFYELYENDAIIANTEFDLKIAGGGRANMKLAGIPEMSFEYWAKEFISHGYKVAKVDQKESMLAKEMRGGSTKEEKIIKRELSSILTGGTLTDLDMISDDMAIYCLAIKEEEMDDGTKIFGVAFVDTATGELNLIEFNDDAECTKLDTLITQVKPKEVLCEKGNLCSTAVKVLKFSAHNTNQIWNNLNPISEFWDYEITVENLVKSKYYEAEDLDDYSKYPSILCLYKDDHKVAFNAFGGLLYYLKLLKLDSNIMTLANFKEYSISKNTASTLILDGVTLNNLEILNNSFDGGDRGTLFKLINRAATPFGKRVLKHWVLHPLMNIKDINERFDAIDFLMNDGLELRTILEQGLTGLPDLERLLARIHSKTLRFKDFLKVVESFERIGHLMSQLENFTSELSGSLHKFVGNFPLESDCVKEWEDAFDREEAKKDIIIPAEGIDEEFDVSQGKIKELESQLETYMKEYKRRFKSHEIVYRDSGKEVFLIEFPNKLTKQIPNDWQQMGATSKVKRYWSPEVKVLVRELMEQRELHKDVCNTLKSRMYGKFDSHYSMWMAVIKALANIDCLLALTRTSETIGYPSCRPGFVESEKGLIEFKDLRHPCFVGTKDFIPNDVCLGGSAPNFGLLTGANAAGKSTIMRTTALAAILAQLGCYVPASLARMSPVDRIMTRLGANDNIMQGKSTFFVELSETKKILSNATPSSLVILDELGRGGSSSDGYAIAESVLYHLSTHVQPLGFFATHYGSLGQSFHNHPQIKPLRMGIVVDNNSRNITFLYKLEEGTAPGSFGMNVASMCGISEEIVANAEIAAKEYEQTAKMKKLNENTQDLSIGLQSDFTWMANGKFGQLSRDVLRYDENVKIGMLNNIFRMVEKI